MSLFITPTMTALHQSIAIAIPDDDNFTDSSSSSRSAYNERCDYEWPTLWIKVTICFFYSIVGLIGFIGNFLVVFTIFFKKGQQSVTSMLLCSLAVSDIIVVTVYLPVKLTDFVVDSWVLGEFACKLFGFLNLMSPACSACMLMVIGLERFVVILYPLKARSFITRTRAKIIVAGTWVVSFLLGVPGFLMQIHVPFDDDYFCKKDYALDNIKKGFNLYGLVVLYILPLGVMGFAYITVSHRLNASTKTSRGMQSMKAPRSSAQQYIYNKPPAEATANRSNGFKALVSNTTPTSVDDDPFSAASETRYDGAGGSVTAGAKPVRQQRKRQRRPVSLKDRQQVILMLILIVVLYAITWGPLLIIAVLFSFGVLNNMCLNTLLQISAASHICAFLNSTVNPIVYSFMSRNFRDTVKDALRSCCRCFLSPYSQNRGGRESMYYNSRCSTTVVTQASGVKRTRSSDGNCSPCRGPNQSIEMNQYSRLPKSDTMA